MSDVATERLRSVIEPALDVTGLSLFDLTHSGGKVVVTVDSPAGDLDMAAIADATRAISRALDAADPISSRYTLEVTSPGIERPLRTPEQFAWAVGREVTVRTTPEHEGERRYTGTLVAVEDDSITIGVASTPPGSVSVPLADIQRARTVFDFDAELRASKNKSTPVPEGQSTCGQGDRGQAARREAGRK